jgi:hypothetical protein
MTVDQASAARRDRAIDDRSPADSLSRSPL